MRLRKLEIKNFRNYNQQQLEPGFSLNVFCGANAQGKTNVLEAIYLACTGRSFRTFKDSEIINWEKDFALISADFATGASEVALKVLLTAGQKKITINGAPAKGFPFGWPGAILFTPDSLNIIKGSPQSRRSFIDLEIGPLDHQYNYSLRSYQRVLLQRNNLLKEIREDQEKTALLETWNKQFCLYGAKIVRARLSLLQQLNKVVKGIYSELTQGGEEISFRYNSSVKVKPGIEEKDLVSSFAQSLKENEKEEIYRGQSGCGPHRDDLIFFINEKEARTYGSQGQQRSLSLALKLSLLKMWYNEAREYPLLLMDDVMSELDEKRQKELLNIVGAEAQTFISSSVLSDLRAGPGAVVKSFIVKDGKIEG